MKNVGLSINPSRVARLHFALPLTRLLRKGHASLPILFHAVHTTVSKELGLQNLFPYLHCFEFGLVRIRRVLVTEDNARPSNTKDGFRNFELASVFLVQLLGG